MFRQDKGKKNKSPKLVSNNTDSIENQSLPSTPETKNIPHKNALNQHEKSTSNEKSKPKKEKQITNKTKVKSKPKNIVHGSKNKETKKEPSPIDTKGKINKANTYSFNSLTQ